MKVEHFNGSTNAEVFFMLGRILTKGPEGEVEALKTLFKVERRKLCKVGEVELKGKRF